MKKNKLVLFILALILLAGIIIVCLKGFNVSLDLRAHDTLKFVFDQKFKMSDVTKVCDEVFKDKEYETKTVEVFSDAVYIISPEITKSEEETLLEKLNELYKTEDSSTEKNTDENSSEETSTDENATENNSLDENTNDSESTSTDESSETTEEKTIFDELEEGTKYDFYHDSKIRLRDIVKPYVIPSVICALIIVVYIGIKYRKLGNWFIIICKTLGEMLVVLLEVMAIIAIARIPFTTSIIPIIMFIIVVSLCIRLEMYERKLEKLDE